MIDPALPDAVSFLEGLGNESSHPVGCLLLHLPCDVGIGVQREARAVMAQNAGDRLDVHSLLDSQSGKCMPLWHNKDKSDNRKRQTSPCLAKVQKM